MLFSLNKCTFRIILFEITQPYIVIENCQQQQQNVYIFAEAMPLALCILCDAMSRIEYTVKSVNRRTAANSLMQHALRSAIEEKHCQRVVVL